MRCPVRLVFFALAALFMAHPARADTIGVHIGSHHMPAKDYNNFNPGMYYRTDAGWTFGGYRNSLRRNTFYAAYTWTFFGFLDVTTGGATGYFAEVQPMVVPSVALFTYQGITPRIAYIPQVEKKIGAHVLHLMVEF